ncbi:lipopolysaccharide biosynthesis protein [Inmirania thermothiophila]|uniref:lipopolysaccharide biosynthesis protein n=1 Tax=Inmirania thermothiophila TaxID=1750597 RepID=UPI0011CD596A|nr:hypothetical protein [Inmirania thermothiophila]
MNILLARWLPPEEYGAFAVALSVFYLLAGFHTAVLTEPMMIFGAGKYREHFRKYLGMVLWGHWGVSALIALGLGIAAWVFHRLGSTPMAQALFGLAVTSPFLLLLWLTRRACYAQLRPIWAVVGSGVNFLVVLGGLFLLWRWREISSFNGFLALGAGALLASLFIATILKPQVAGYVGTPTASMVVGDHREYGKWNILAFSLYWASGQILMVLIPIFLGLEASAAVAATLTLYRPVQQTVQALGSLVLPVFSRTVSGPGGRERLRKEATFVALLFGGGVGLYSLIVSVFSRPILHLLYGGKYDEHWVLIVLLGVALSFSAVTGAFVSVLKASGNVADVTKIWTISTLVTSALAIPLMQILNVKGAVFALLVGYALATFGSFRYFIKKVGHEGKR